MVREEVLKALEPARAAKTISSGLEARVTFCGQGELASLLRKYAANLPGLFIVSQVEIAEGKLEGATGSTALEGLQIHVERAQGREMRALLELFHARGRKQRITQRSASAASRRLTEIERDGGVLAVERAVLMTDASRPNLIGLSLLSLGALAADQLSKHAVERYTAPGSLRVLVPGC